VQVSIAQETTGGVSQVADPVKTAKDPSRGVDSGNRFRKELPEGSEGDPKYSAPPEPRLETVEISKTIALPASSFESGKAFPDQGVLLQQATKPDGGHWYNEKGAGKGWIEVPANTATEVINARDAAFGQKEPAFAANAQENGALQAAKNVGSAVDAQTPSTILDMAEDVQKPVLSAAPVALEATTKNSSTTPAAMNILGLAPIDENDKASQTPLGADAEIGRHSTGRTGLAPPSGATMLQPDASPTLVRGVAVQIAQAMPSGADRSVEISLDPVELGKVRLTLNMTESGMAVQILADRPETLELMRKNTDALTAEFLEMGYAEVGFQFAQNHEGKPDEGANKPAIWAEPTGMQHQIDGPQVPAAARSFTQGDQLDLRL